MKTLLTLLMVLFLVSCGGDNTTDTKTSTTTDPTTDGISYNPVDVQHGYLTYDQFEDAVKDGKFLNLFRNCNYYTATYRHFHTEHTSGSFLFFTTNSYVRVYDESFERKIVQRELEYSYDAFGSQTNDPLDVLILMHEILDNRNTGFTPYQMGPAMYAIRTTSGIDYIIDLNAPVWMNPIRVYDNETSEGYEFVSQSICYY